MKKAVTMTIALLLCLTVLWGCTQEHTEPTTQGSFCRVLCLQNDGMIVEIPDMDLGYVYVKHINADLQIDPLDTVVMEFSESDLKPANEAFVDFFGVERIYEYTLEAPISIRLADTSKGEPTFG